jgi:crotonobetainyl-CoA:carnitine CoA-transferase CaiB-like acyl-CoA transferase
VRFSDDLAPLRPHLPELGEHTEEVLLQAGYSWDDITELSEAGAI